MTETQQQVADKLNEVWPTVEIPATIKGRYESFFMRVIEDGGYFYVALKGMNGMKGVRFSRGIDVPSDATPFLRSDWAFNFLEGMVKRFESGMVEAEGSK